MKRAKRVWFQDRVPDRSQSGRFDNASAPCNSTEAPPPASNNPKTSEFAFFKKFREDASLKHQSKSPPRGNIQLKCSKGKNHGGGVTDNKKISNSSLFAENARPSKTDLLVSPQFVSSSLIKTNGRKNQEQDLTFSCLIKTPTSSGPDDFFLERATESARSDTRYVDGDIFSKKRAKLQSSIAKTTNPGNGEVLMGCDLISLLLNRLIPESFESNHCEAFKSTPDKEETEYQSLCLPESSYLKESWTDSERKLVKREKPYFMDVDASSSLSNKIKWSFLLEEPVQSACLPELECAEHMVLGHQYKEIEPCYFSNIDYKQSWNKNSAEAFVESNAKSYGNFGTFNPRRMTLEYDSVKEHSLNDDPSSSWNYRLNSTPCTNRYGNKFLLEYEKKEPECIADINTGSMFGNSPGNCRSSALTTFIESDELNDDLGHLRFRRKASDLLLGWDIDRLKEKEIRYSFPVDTRSDFPLTIPCELLPAVDDNGFFFSPSQQCLFPQRSYNHAIEAPVTANSSSYLLLEGGEDERRKSTGVREICFDSTTSMSNELLWSSQIQKLDWRDNEEEMYVL